jgi:hypothetical protein
MVIYERGRLPGEARTVWWSEAHSIQHYPGRDPFEKEDVMKSQFVKSPTRPRRVGSHAVYEVPQVKNSQRVKPRQHKDNNGEGIKTEKWL